MIFDTDILIWFLRRHPRAAEFIDSVPVGERNLSAISYLELLYGCRTREDLREVHRAIAELIAEVLPLTEGLTKTAQELMERFVLSRRPDAEDVLIAATALSRHEEVATGNLKRFNFIPGLIVKPFRP